jgi:hypothetical protein
VRVEGFWPVFKTATGSIGRLESDVSDLADLSPGAIAACRSRSPPTVISWFAGFGPGPTPTMVFPLDADGGFDVIPVDPEQDMPDLLLYRAPP